MRSFFESQTSRSSYHSGEVVFPQLTSSPYSSHPISSVMIGLSMRVQSVGSDSQERVSDFWYSSSSFHSWLVDPDSFSANFFHSGMVAKTDRWVESSFSFRSWSW